MKTLKPVWTEGLFLTQHHFQQLDRYHETLLDERCASLAPFPWGVVDLEIDERLLEAGQLKLTSFSAVFPDGTPVSCGEKTNDVLQRAIGDAFTAQMRSLDVHVGLPRQSETHANVDLEGRSGAPVRFIREQNSVADVNTGKGEQELPWARPNLRLLLGSESRESFDTIRVATLMRSSGGSIILHLAGVPPVMRIGAAPFLTQGIRRLLEAMTARQRSLASSRRQRSAASIDFQASDAAKFWLLNTLNSFIPVIAHMLDQPRTHPEAMYLALAQLTGELCTFAPDGDPTDIPKFNFLQLGDTFMPLFSRILTLLETVIAERYVEIPLKRRDDGMYLGQLQDPTVLRYEFFLAATSNIPEAQVRDRLPKLTKIASWQQVPSILNSAINGARLELEYSPPGALPIKPGMVFFKVNKTPDYWTDIQGTGTIAIYQPLEPKAVNLSLYAVDPENL